MTHTKDESKEKSIFFLPEEFHPNEPYSELWAVTAYKMKERLEKEDWNE